MKAIFDQRGIIPQHLLPHEMLRPFNLYQEYENSPKFVETMCEILRHNNFGRFAAKGRTEDEQAQNLLYGFAAEAWMQLHGLIPDTRKFRDAFILRNGRLVPIDVKTIESKYYNPWLTLEEMSAKVVNDTHGNSDLEELYFWRYFNDNHPSRPGDLEFLRAYRRLDNEFH